MSEIVKLLELELGNRLDEKVWSQETVYTDLWYLIHVPPGKPVRVEENGIALTEQANIIDTKDNPGSWIWGEDAANETRQNVGTYEFGITEQYAYGGKNAEKYWNQFSPEDNWLIIHTTGSDDPAGGSYIILSFFYEYLTSALYKDYDVVFNGQLYLPYLSDEHISDISSGVSSFGKGQIHRSFGTIKIINADGRYDTRIVDYIYEAKKAVLKKGDKGAVYGSYITCWLGWTGSVDWDDKILGIDIEDLRTRN